MVQRICDVDISVCYRKHQLYQPAVRPRPNVRINSRRQPIISLLRITHKQLEMYSLGTVVCTCYAWTGPLPSPHPSLLAFRGRNKTLNSSCESNRHFSRGWFECLRFCSKLAWLVWRGFCRLPIASAQSTPSSFSPLSTLFSFGRMLGHFWRE